MKFNDGQISRKLAILLPAVSHFPLQKSLSFNFPSRLDRHAGGQGVGDLVAVLEVLIMVLMAMCRALMIRRPVLYFASFHIFASRRGRCLLVPLSPYRIHSSFSCRAKEIHSDKMECFHSQPFFFNSNYSETNTLISPSH